MRAVGVTRALPTLITSSFEDFSASARVIAGMADQAVAGIHMEGPYISPEDGPRGAHPREHVRAASLDDFERRQDAAGGRIVLVTLAPEVPGAVPLIERLVSRGVCAAIGHTAASPRQIADAIAAGATLSTHLGNGCASVLPRHPNVIWEQLASDALHASLIVDGHHLPASTVRALVRAKGAERTILVTDATAAAGSAPGRYRIGAVEGELGADGRVSLPGTPFLAGSSLTLDRAVANTARFTGLSIDAVIPMASTIPARLIGATPAGTVSAEWDPERFELQIIGVRPGSDRGQTGVRPAGADSDKKNARSDYGHCSPRLGGARRLPDRHHGDRVDRRVSRPPERRVLPRRPEVRSMADDRSELRRRHARRDAGGACRSCLQRRRIGDLVSVEEPLHHAVLLADGPRFPAHSPDDHGRVHRRSLRLLDGGDLHRLCGVLLHHQYRQHAQGRRQGDQPGNRGRDWRERDRRGDDGHVHPLQLRRRPRCGRLDGPLSRHPHHRPVLHVDSARLARGRGTGRHAGIARAVQILSGDAVGHRAVGDRDADAQRPGRHHGPAASARYGRHGQGRADVPDRDARRQHGQAGLHCRLGVGRA